MRYHIDLNGLRPITESPEKMLVGLIRGDIPDDFDYEILQSLLDHPNILFRYPSTPSPMLRERLSTIQGNVNWLWQIVKEADTCAEINRVVIVSWFAPSSRGVYVETVHAHNNVLAPYFRVIYIDELLPHL